MTAACPGCGLSGTIFPDLLHSFLLRFGVLRCRMADFSIISEKYEKDSIVQRSASEILLELTGTHAAEDVLDLGCGTGHLTKLIKEKTSGRVIGIDPAVGMIEQAAKYADERLSFRLLAADQLD